MVYLIHFERRYKHAQHYVGFTNSRASLRSRVYHHRQGTGSRLLRAVNRADIAWDVVRTWDGGDRHFERRLHNAKNSRKLCPICNPKTWMQNYKNTLEESIHND